MCHHRCVAPGLLAIGGMIALAFGVWRMACVPPRRPVAYLICAFGVGLIAMGAGWAGSNWGLRIGAAGMYSSAGISLGATAAAISARRLAGTILASLGAVATAGFRIVSGIACSFGMFAVVMQLLDAHRPAPAFQLLGQALFFSTLGMQTLMIAKSQWRLADHGIIGTNLFVPWQQVSAWDWQDANTLVIQLRPGFSRARKFTISVAPEARDGAAAILAGKLHA